MTTNGNPTMVRQHALVLLGAFLLIGSQLALAGDSENEQLAIFVRQLDMLDRTAHQAAKFSHEGATRYRFDYDRLRADVARVRAGVTGYLIPERAQPLDPVDLPGQYHIESAESP